MPKTYRAAVDLAPLLDGSSAGELIPELATRGLQQLIELEVAAFLGADRHERSEERLGDRNGYRPRTLTTQVGDLALQIPKLRAGSFLPSILEPRRRVDQALYAVIMEAYIGGVSTRKVDALVAALGSQSGISKSQVSRICQEIDQQVQAFLSRSLESSSYAYVYLDATYLKGRLGKAQQVCSRAVVVAMGVNEDGRRELLGLKVGDSESEPFWAEFIAHLKERGLAGVTLGISEAHAGLTQAIGRRSMIPRRQGKVLVIASIAGLRGNRPDEGEMIGYNTTKGGLVNFTRTLAAEWGEHNINVNALAPGFFETKMTRGLLAKQGAALTAHAPLARLGDEEDLKGAAVLLCSEAGRHITGQIIAVDGGVMAA